VPDWGALFSIGVQPLELVVRGTAMYWFLFLLFRFVLRRDVGSIGIADVLLLVLIADAAQNAMAGSYESITEGCLLVATIVGWNWLMDFATWRFASLRRLLEPRPLPLVDTLHRNISLGGIDESLQSGAIEAVAVTASSYTTGVHWTFCHASRDRSADIWNRPGRRAEFQPPTIEHLMASSAIPFLFPATPLWVDGRREYFDDGSMRQISPLSSALHLGAHRVLVVGVGQPQRSGVGNVNAGGPARQPTFGGIAGHALASVFHDTLQADVEQAQRVTGTLRQLPRQVAGVLPYRSVEVLAIHPSRSLDALAQGSVGELPLSLRRALRALGALRGGGAMASYLLFEPRFVQSLMQLGAQDAYARKDELLAHFEVVTA
jgi:NTE family protein